MANAPAAVRVGRADHRRHGRRGRPGKPHTCPLGDRALLRDRHEPGRRAAGHDLAGGGASAGSATARAGSRPATTPTSSPSTATRSPTRRRCTRSGRSTHAASRSADRSRPSQPSHPTPSPAPARLTESTRTALSVRWADRKCRSGRAVAAQPRPPRHNPGRRGASLVVGSAELHAVSMEPAAADPTRLIPYAGDVIRVLGECEGIASVS